MEIDLNKVGRDFSPEKGWTIIPVSSGEIDLRDTKKGERIKCIDFRYGIKPNGSYDPDSVPRSPAWLGAIDGISAFLGGESEERAQEAAKLIRGTGFTPADHGDNLRGDIEGCAFRRALLEKKFPDLNILTIEETRILRAKMGVEHVTLNRTDNHPKGFLLNPYRMTTALPDDGQYYPIDIWYPDYLGIEQDRFLPVIEKCGQLLLPPESRTLFVVR